MLYFVHYNSTFWLSGFHIICNIHLQGLLNQVFPSAWSVSSAHVSNCPSVLSAQVPKCFSIAEVFKVSKYRSVLSAQVPQVVFKCLKCQKFKCPRPIKTLQIYQGSKCLKCLNCPVALNAQVLKTLASYWPWVTFEVSCRCFHAKFFQVIIFRSWICIPFFAEKSS